MASPTIATTATIPMTIPAIAPPLIDDELDEDFEEVDVFVGEEDVVCAEPETVDARLASETGAVEGIAETDVIAVGTAARAVATVVNAPVSPAETAEVAILSANAASTPTKGFLKVFA